MFRKKRIKMLEKELKEKEFEIQELERMLDTDNVDFDKLTRKLEKKNDLIDDLKENNHFLELEIEELKSYIEKIRTGEWVIASEEYRNKTKEKQEAYKELQCLVRRFEDTTGICTDYDSDRYYDLYEKDIQEEAKIISMGFYADLASLDSIKADCDSYKEYMNERYNELEK